MDTPPLHLRSIVVNIPVKYFDIKEKCLFFAERADGNLQFELIKQIQVFSKMLLTTYSQSAYLYLH